METKSNDVLEVGAVIYADGSARPNPGPHGSGIHGYTYVYPEGKDKPTKTNAWVATDKGYVLEKDLAKSEGKPVLVVNYYDGFESHPAPGTNNIGEIRAIGLFFELHPDVVARIETIHFLTDSQYTIKAFTQWIYGWIKNNWINSQGVTVSNRNHIELVQSYLDNFRSAGKTCTFAYVRGHNDDLGNVRADYLAGIGTNRSSVSVVGPKSVESKPNGYTKCDSKIHDLLSLRRLYFNTDPNYNKRGVYHQTSANEKTPDGKQLPEAVFSIIELKEPDAVVESVISKQCSYGDRYKFNNVLYIKLDKLRSGGVYPYLESYGGDTLYHDNRNLSLNFLDHKPLTFEPKRDELPLKVIDTINLLSDQLEKFKNQYMPTGHADNCEVHDVTDQFYNRVEKKSGKSTIVVKELKKEHGVGVKNVKLSVTETHLGESKVIPLGLVFEDDIPSRNVLKRLESSNPSIFLITWKESERLLRYATVIQTDDALGIWSNYFANVFLFA